MADIVLLPLEASDRNQFVLDNQEAFNYGALVEFGLRDDHFEEPDEIISRETIEKSIDGGEAYRIMQDGKPVGGVIIKVEGDRGDLDILFVSPKVHSTIRWVRLIQQLFHGSRIMDIRSMGRCSIFTMLGRFRHRIRTNLLPRHVSRWNNPVWPGSVCAPWPVYRRV